MINSCDFVKHKIDELVIQFPSIKCSYEFEVSDGTHSVEILPTEFFKLSEEFTIVENNIYHEFFELFPYEGLYFITNDVFIPISNAIYTRQGCDYPRSVKFNEIGHSKSNPLNNTINYITTNQSIFKVRDFAFKK